MSLSGIPGRKSYSSDRLQDLVIIAVIVAIIGGSALLYLNRSESKPKVGVINVSGTIEGFEYANLAERAQDDSSIKAVVLNVNSPGGSLTGTFQTESSLSRLEKPLVASLGEIAASGAYVIASASDYIYAYDQTLTAGLGVIAIWVSYKDYYENRGIDYFIWKSGEEKDMFSPWRKPTEEENARLQEMVENFSAELFSRITTNRPETSGYLDNLRDGSTVYGTEALILHLIDNLGTNEDAVLKAASMAGLEKGEFETVNLSEYYGNNS